MAGNPSSVIFQKIFQSRKNLNKLISSTPFDLEIHQNLVFWNDENGAAPVANQLRYAADHFLRYKTNDDDDITELVKCQGHLRRAEFDAVEMLSVKVDNAIESIRITMGDYMNLLLKDLDSWEKNRDMSLQRNRSLFDFDNVDYGDRDKAEATNKDYLERSLIMLNEYENCTNEIVHHKSREQFFKYVKIIMSILILLSVIAGGLLTLGKLANKLLDFFP